jgi:6-phosphogluconolactonase (cycloisomerase 2 family)
MKTLGFLLPLALCLQWAVVAEAGTPASKPATPSYLITNDDLPTKIGATAGTVFTIASDGAPQNPFKVTLGGAGGAGGYFTANRVSVLQSTTYACAYLSIAAAGEVGAVDLNALQDIGNFSASSTDSGVDNGIGLANNGTYLYASFSTSNTVAAFAILPGCSLNYLGEISPLGKNAGNVKGMAVHGNTLVIAYGDGSIESFNVSAGIPVSNGDLQYATGYFTSRYPVGVDITQDGHFAIFGDQSNTTTVEVSDISSGKLTKTVLYNVAAAGNATSVYLSPDETLLYIANTSVGKVTAAFFNATTGKVSPGCTSATLKGFDNNWVFLSSPVTELNTGTGSVLYLAEYGAFSGMAVVDVTSSGGKCSLKETKASPVIDPNSTTLLSIGVYPARRF